MGPSCLIGPVIIFSEKILIKGKGFTDVGGSVRGNQINIIQVKIPKDLSSTEKDKLKEIEAIHKNQPNPAP